MEVLYKLEYKPCLHFPLKLQKAKEVSHFEMLLFLLVLSCTHVCLKLLGLLVVALPSEEQLFKHHLVLR